MSNLHLKPKKKILLVCFDMWGTLCHGGGRTQMEELKKILGGNRLTYEEFLPHVEDQLMTKDIPLAQSIMNLGQELNLKTDKNTIKKAVNLWKKWIKSLKPYPETEAVIKKIFELGIKTCIVSNSDTLSVNEKIKQLGWNKYFDKIFVSAQLGILKPDKKIFQIVEKYYRLAKEQVIYVDDSYYHGILPVKNFGWKTLWLQRQSADKNTIRNLKDVLKFIDYEK